MRNKIVFISIIIILLFLIFGKFFGMGREFYVPAMSAFFGAFFAFVLSLMNEFSREDQKERFAIQEAGFILPIMKNAIGEIHKCYENTEKGVVYIGYYVPKINTEKLLFLVKNKGGTEIIKKLFLANSIYDQILSCLLSRNKLLVEGQENCEAFKATTKKIESEFNSYSGDFDEIINSLSKLKGG